MSPARGKSIILLVEDDPSLRAFYRNVLSLEGYAVITAEDGVDALRRFEAEPQIGAVVLDLALPRLGGEDVGNEIGAHPASRGVPIIVVTASEATHLNPEIFKCVLHKPVTPEKLIAAVERCLRDASKQSG